MSFFQYSQKSANPLEDTVDYWVKFYGKFGQRKDWIKNLKIFQERKKTISLKFSKSFEARIKALKILIKG